MAPGPRARRFRSRLRRLLLAAGGIVALQLIVFGPSLAGGKILLPADLLAQPGFLLPRTPASGAVRPHDTVQGDQVLQYEPLRRFCAAEFRAGRAPLWAPFEHRGAPLAVFPKYSAFNLIYYCFPTPYALAWIQLVKALVGGAGTYFFCRRVLGVSFVPAALGAACYPLTGYLIVWEGHYLSATAVFYPWLLLAVDRVVRRPGGAWGPGLAVLTALVLTVGATDVAGEALLAAGLFALWRFASRGRRSGWRRTCGAAAALTAAWSVGFLLAAPYLLPMANYLPTGARMVRRAQGTEERPPLGAEVLPQAFLPLTYGTSRTGSFYLLEEKGYYPESAAPAYAGVLAALALAPLAWFRRRLRGVHLALLGLGALGLAWLLDLPLLVPLMRLPGLNMLSFNRFTFATGFATLALAVSGLEVLRRGVPARRRLYALPALALLALGAWCLTRAADPPEPLATRLEALARQRPSFMSEEEARATRRGFVEYHRIGAGLRRAGLLFWAGCWRGLPSRAWLVLLAGGAWAGELLWFAVPVNAQCDPALYYPPVPALERLAAAPPGRMVGLNCLPPALSGACGLRDVRGYDAVDPLPLVELLETVKDRRFPSAEYAATQDYVPILPLGPDGKVRLPPVLSMLNLRYVVGRGRPPGPMTPLILLDDYWVWENEDVLPRAFVPASVRPAPDRGSLLRLLGAPDFDPRQVAYADGAPPLPPSCRGTAEVVAEVPTHLTVDLDMQTPGLVVLSDLDYEGWRATLDGRPVPVLRANHALRGVVVPAGHGRLEFDYQPAGHAAGLRLGLLGLSALVLWPGLRWVARWVARRVGERGRVSAP